MPSIPVAGPGMESQPPCPPLSDLLSSHAAYNLRLLSVEVTSEALFQLAVLFSLSRVYFGASS